MTGGSEDVASSRRYWRLGVLAATVALLALVVGAVLTVSRGAAQSSPAPPAGPTAITTAGDVPPPTSRFVAAYGRGDMATLERSASPLYFLEWERRGVSLSAQASLIQDHRRAPTGEWLFFSFGTSFVDRRGFGHYIYVGRPISTTGSPSASVWRVDADATGRVIWIEMVWLFSGKSLSFESLPPDIARDDSALRALLPSSSLDLVFGVRSSDGLEGYYGVGGTRRVASEASRQDDVQFYVVDDSGAYRMPAWTYGERIPNRPRAGAEQLQAEQQHILGDYLASIR